MEQAVVFDVAGDEVPGILHPGAPRASCGVLIVVGGPQYRVGSHRQFLLLARDLASAGIPVLRFDYRGMGDAGGDQRDFEQVHVDISAAVDTFMAQSGLREVVLWGLCDAASAALTYAWQDPRIAGLVLANPWVRTEAGEAKAYLKHYYLRRLVSPDFWSGVVRGRLNPVASARSLLRFSATIVKGDHQRETSGLPDAPLPDRMAEGWKRFPGPILVILSGDDLTAAEFRDTARTSKVWQGLLDASRVTTRELAAANHTFSRRAWRDQVAAWTLTWVKDIGTRSS